ncbi:MAG: transglycosylase SLT domain-containing protein, partial [Polyangiaceae bacterium]
LPPGADAPALVVKLDPKHPMTAAEWMQRVGVLAGSGRLDDALRAIDFARKAPGASKVTRVERLRARGMALYHARGHFGEAATLLSECANAGGPEAAEDAFHAARALSRADRDEEAIRGYRQVARRFPKSKVADEAAFLEPYLWMLHGDWSRCSRGFSTYLRDHPAGDEAHNARRDGALCDLLSGDTKPARASYERLVEDEPDPIVSARMEDMAALAALHDGDRTHAVARWTDVARSRPLSWPALVARSRLEDVGAPVPPAIDPTPAAGPDPTPIVVRLPPPADLLHALGLEGDAEAALREREGALAIGAGPRAPEVLCQAYGELGRARRRYQLAQSLPSSLFASAPTPRTRWAWDCAFPSPYAGTVTSAEGAEKLPRGLLWAVMRQESAFDPDAVSPARAVGLMQIMPETARPIAQALSLGSDDARLTSPPYAIPIAARLLRDLLGRFHGDVPLAVAAYNAGGDAVERWISRAPGMQIDTFVERIPYAETRDYVARVMGNLARYAYLSGGEAGVPRLDLALPSR